MKPELQQKLNTAIAEWMGWQYLPTAITPYGANEPDYRWHNDKMEEQLSVPNYCSSLDACHEVIVRMDINQRTRVWQWLIDNSPSNFDFEHDAPTMARAIAYALGLWDGKEKDE